MTKEKYLEMCELLGTEPIDSEMPIERSDFVEEIQTALDLYDFLPSVWESATYIGKDYTFLEYLFKIKDIPVNEQKFILYIVKIIDHKVSEDITKKQKQMQESYERKHGKKKSNN